MSGPSGGIPAEALARVAQVNQAWDIIQSAVADRSGADLNPAKLLLTQVAATGDNLDALGAGLDLAHWPYFQAFAEGATPTADEVADVQTNLADFAETITGPAFEVTDLRPGEATTLRVAVAAQLIGRVVGPEHIAYPCPPGMRNPSYVDASGRGAYRHLHVLTPHGTVPSRVVDTLNSTKRERDRDPVEVLALGNLIELYGGPFGDETIRPSRQRLAALGYTAGVLAADNRNEINDDDPDLSVVGEISDEIFAQVDSSRHKFRGIF